MGSITQMLTKSSKTIRAGDPVVDEEVRGYGKPRLRTFLEREARALTQACALSAEAQGRVVQRFHARMQNMKSIPPRFIVKDGPIVQNVMEGDACERSLNSRCRATMSRTRRASSAPATASSPRDTDRLVRSRRLSLAGYDGKTIAAVRRRRTRPHPPRHLFRRRYAGALRRGGRRLRRRRPPRSARHSHGRARACRCRHLCRKMERKESHSPPPAAQAG